MASSSVKCSTGVPASDPCGVLSSSAGVDTRDACGLAFAITGVQMTLGEWPLNHPPEQQL